ncbi:oligosaccharide flippase family protein [Candidatus Sumerlaeota bacterium]|nr:oligosaccharide flippase family protein [Candidatus Sumerlaeota bacterium]
MTVGQMGFGIWGNLRLLVDLFESVLPQGFQQGVTRRVAELRAGNDDEALRRFAGASLTVFAGIAAISTLIVYLFADTLALKYTGSADNAPLVRLIAAALPGLTFSGLLYAVLRGLKRVRRLALISAAAAAIMAGVAIPLIVLFELPGLLLSLTVVELLQIALLTRAVKRDLTLTLQLPRWEDWRMFSGLGALLFGSGIVTWTSNNWLRVDYLALYGAETAGLFEAAFRLTNFILAAVLATMMAHVFPRMSEIESREEFSRELNLTLRAYLLVCTPGLLITALLENELLALFYDSTFIDAARMHLMAPLLMACFFQIVMWCFMITLIPRKRHAAYFLTCLGIALVIPAFYLPLRQADIPASLALAMPPAYALIGLGLMLYLMLRMGFYWEWAAFRMAAVSALVLFWALFLGGDATEFRLMRIAALPLWAALAVPLGEWRRYLRQSRELLRERLRESR